MEWQGTRRNNRQLGATDKELETIPLIMFEDVHKELTREDARCSICLEEYECEDTLRKIRCGHYFHRPCVDSWLYINKCCPLCKQVIDEAIDMRRTVDTIV